MASRVHLSWLAVLVAAEAATCVGCREQPAAQAATRTQQTDAASSISREASEVAPPETEGDRVIRQELDAAIQHDSALKTRSVRFKVVAGDVTATGTVATETERQKVNELAMQVNGVKSVANAVRVSPAEGGH